MFIFFLFVLSPCPSNVTFFLKEHEWVICDDCPRNYVYPKGSFSKWKEQFILEARYVGNESKLGEWVNVSKYLNFSLIYPDDPNVPKLDQYNEFKVMQSFDPLDTTQAAIRIQEIYQN